MNIALGVQINKEIQDPKSQEVEHIDIHTHECVMPVREDAYHREHEWPASILAEGLLWIIQR